MKTMKKPIYEQNAKECEATLDHMLAVTAPKKRKAKRVVAKRMWLTMQSGIISSIRMKHDVPVDVLPADPESVAAMVEQVALALISKWGAHGEKDAEIQYRDDARTALAAIGIKSE